VAKCDSDAARLGPPRTLSLWAVLTVVAFPAVIVFATIASVFVMRLVRRPTLPMTEEVGGIPRVLRKLRKREPMWDEELAVARQAVSDRGSLMALCIPGAIFSIGCFYVFGSLDYLHGATPSERTFLGVIPMFTSTNLAIRMLSQDNRARPMDPYADCRARPATIAVVPGGLARNSTVIAGSAYWASARSADGL
jgi:hypothetical protein